MVDEAGGVITDISNQGVSVLLVEQNIRLACMVAKKGYALQCGIVVLKGDIEEFKSTDIVRRAYLGA